MPAAGVEPEDRTLAIMAKADVLLSSKHTTEMMKCTTSDSRREYMSQIKADGCLPNVYQFNVLIQQLLSEGKKEEAQRVIDEEMPAAGVEPSEKTFETMQREDQLKIMGRGSRNNSENHGKGRRIVVSKAHNRDDEMQDLG